MPGATSESAGYHRQGDGHLARMDVASAAGDDDVRRRRHPTRARGFDGVGPLALSGLIVRRRAVCSAAAVARELRVALDEPAQVRAALSIVSSACASLGSISGFCSIIRPA